VLLNGFEKRRIRVDGFKWLHLAAEKNEVSAQYYLGYFYEKGRGVSPDRFEAMDWYIKAVTQGHAASKKRLERLRQTADAARTGGLVQDEWWMMPLDNLIQKAEQGDVESQAYLGYRYEGYGGTGIDVEKSIYWLGKAAAQTNQDARYSLSQLYSLTTNMIPDQAFYHCSIAAEGGCPEAQRELGEYYRIGFGTRSDRVKALHWLSRAEQSGDEVAGRSIYSLIQGRAAFTEVRTNWVVSEDYVSPPIKMVIRDLDNQERIVKFLKYDPSKKQVQTDYQYGDSFMLPLSAFRSDSQAVIQNALKLKAFENGLKVEFIKEVLTRKGCEELGYTAREEGDSVYKYDGVVYGLNILNGSDFFPFDNLNIESRVYYEKTEQWWGAYGKGKKDETQHYKEKSYNMMDLKSGATREFKADPVVVESYETRDGVYYNNAPTDVESKILGIRIRIFFKMTDGRIIYRDVCEPSALKLKTTWE